VISLLLSLAPVTPLARPADPVPTTIAAIRADPRKFDGKVVRLSGWVNRCVALSCGIEERAASDPGGAGQRLSIAADAKFDSVVAPIAPTPVEFDARFDAGCITVRACSDRAPVLTIVTLRSVVSLEPPPIEN
jgi:hypothetical protein